MGNEPPNANAQTHSKTSFLIVALAIGIGLVHYSGLIDVGKTVSTVSTEENMEGPLDLHALTLKAQQGELASRNLLSLYDALTFLSECDPKSIGYLKPNENSNKAEARFEEAAKLASKEKNCDPLVWHGQLKMALGEIDKAVSLFEKAAEVSDQTCKARSNLNLGLIAELREDFTKAKELFIEARQGSEFIHENFLDRDYDVTEPVVKPSAVAPRLFRASAFRTYYEQFYNLRDNDSALEFSALSKEDGGSYIRGGTQRLEEARDHLAKHGYAVLRGFLSPWETKTIQSFYSHLIEIGVIDNFDPNLGRTTTYNDRMGHWMGQSFTDTLSAIGGRPLKHVYSFLCWHSTKEGNGNAATLFPHTDREDNDYTISIQMHYDDTSGETAWPVWVHGKKLQVPKAGWQPKPPLDESVEVRLSNGDALLFRGREHIHWREDMPSTASSFSSLLLHFVHKEWDWKDFKLRQTIDPSI